MILKKSKRNEKDRKRKMRRGNFGNFEVTVLVWPGTYQLRN
jgi:hypothetical protein